MKFAFGDIVVVDGIEIGVICKSWETFKDEDKVFSYDVYVRSYNGIKEYKEEDIQRYMVRHKFLSEEDYECQQYAINGS